jgi:hypothetical protein
LPARVAHEEKAASTVAGGGGPNDVVITAHSLRIQYPVDLLRYLDAYFFARRTTSTA